MTLLLNGITIKSRIKDNFINATQLCEVAKNRPYKETAEELENNLKKVICDIAYRIFN